MGCIMPRSMQPAYAPQEVRKMNKSTRPNGCTRCCWRVCCGRELKEFEEMELYYKKAILDETFEEAGLDNEK